MPVRAMFTGTSATISALQMICGRKDHKTLFVGVVIGFFFLRFQVANIRLKHAFSKILSRSLQRRCNGISAYV